MELQNITKTPKKKRGTQDSIFSEELEKSLPLKDVLVLGHHLATELGFSDSCDTLGKWMSHHLAEKMERAEHENDLDKKEEYQQQAVELIFKIWGHRYSLAGDAYPLAKFKDIIDSLTIATQGINPWERSRIGRYESLAADTFSMMINLYRGLHFVEFTSLKSVKEKKVPQSTLSDDEQQMYDILVSWAEDEMKFRSDKGFSDGKSESQEAAGYLCSYIDELREKLKDLKGEIEKI